MKLKDNRPLIFMLGYTILSAVTIVVDCFNGGSKLFRTVLALFTMWFMFWVYKKTFLKKSEVIFYPMFLFIFFAMYMGKIFDLYERVPNYDKILHLLSGVIIALLGFMIFLNLNHGKFQGDFHPLFAMTFSIFFAMAVAGGWEIWEFTTDQLWGFASQNNSLIDTMLDIICGTVMGVITNIPIYLQSKGKKIYFVDKIINEMNK